MNLRELIRCAQAYVELPPAMARGWHGLNQHWMAVIGVDESGSGYYRDYSEIHLRRLVSWVLVGEVTGRTDGSHSAVHHEATDLLTASEHGWVVMSEGRARWVGRPSASVFRRGAVCIPVPDWDRHLDAEESLASTASAAW